METASRHILCLICVFLSAFCLRGQTAEENDAMLDKYELICRDCLELKAKVKKGELVFRKDAVEMIKVFVSLNSQIKSISHTLTPAQNTRFTAISKWFSTGTRPSVLDFEAMPVIIPFSSPSLSSSPVPIQIIRPLEKREENKPQKERRTYISAALSIPEMAYGIMAGHTTGRWGGYACFRSNFQTRKPSYSCTGDGILGTGSTFWSNGKSIRSSFSTTIGPMFNALDWLTIYSGIGYGYSKLYWQDIDNSWAIISDHSHSGLVIEAGFMTQWKSLIFSVGVATICFHTASPNISLGYVF